MHINHPPIVTRARHGLPHSLNRRRNYRAHYWTPWTAATALVIVCIAIMGGIIANQ